MDGELLGQYEIIEKIGQGGMGEVYRACDTKLGREVAIKVLPPVFAGDEERLGRFRREAKLLASLNHPNIATLFGLENADGRHFLAMELVEGEDLAERITRRALPLRESLKIVRHVADALQYAHAHGIVHRDLKPANVKVTPDGKVKVLDFGLAKALETDANDPNLSQSPTVATAGGTIGGVILGTAAYMSPEQARGKQVDKLTDVWAIGCVLYELLTGSRAFPGETVSDTIAKILEREPEWAALPGDTPPTVKRLLHRCLQKDRSKRLQDVGEVRVELDGVLSGESEVWSELARTADQPAKRGIATASRVWIAVAVAAVVAASAFAAAWMREPSREARVVRSSIPQPPDSRFVSMGDYAGPVVISPDGTRIAFVATDTSLKRKLYVRELDGLEAVAVQGTDDAAFPFWSPDGRSLGYFTDTKLMRVELSGGLPITVCDAVNGRGGTWSKNGVILFSPDFRVPIHRVPASGGAATAVTKIDTTMHSTHRWPVFMPDGRHFLYVAAHHDVSMSEHYGLYFASLDGSVDKRLLTTGAAAVYASGYLLYVRENTLMAAKFDPEKGEFTSEPYTMVDKVQYDPTTWRAAFSASETGILVYHGGRNEGGLNTRLVVVDRNGAEIDVVDETDVYYHLSLSPDGKRLACTGGSSAGGANGLSIWIYELERDLRTRLTFNEGADISPVWSPDGSRVVYSTIHPGARNPRNRLSFALANGGGEEILYESTKEMWVTDWSADGKYLVFTVGNFVSGSGDLWIMPLFGDREPYPYLATEFEEDSGALSPDGRWMAYSSRDGVQTQIFVSPFLPGDSGDSRAGKRGLAKWQISTESNSVSGSLPLWRADGKEIFFINTDGKIWSAAVDGTGDSFHVGLVQVLCITDPWNFGRIGYDVAADGQRFIVNAFSKSVTSPITLVQNWTVDLKR